jgi:6-phosphogluconolactonase
MKPSQRQQETQAAFSRRGLLKTGAAALSLAASGAVQTQAQDNAAPSSSRIFAYVGTYTGAIGSGGNGQGIYLFSMNPNNGVLAQVKVVSEVSSPSWIAFNPSRTNLYAVNEISNFNGTTSGSVSAFGINRANGNLDFLNAVSSQGAGPAHLSVDRFGKFLFVANYGGGSIAVLPILSDGSLDNATDTHQDMDSVNMTRATNAPFGSFAISGHEAPHAHFIEADPSNKFVLWTDLAQDRIYVYSFDIQAGVLSPATRPFVSLPPGDGPRHLALHPNGKWIYSIQEEASTIVFYEFDSSTGALISQQSISTLPRRFTGTNFTSEIIISPDGLFLYAANRLHDTIAVFSIDTIGGLSRVGESSTLGDYPRHINIDPTGNFLYSCNQRSDAITSFRIDRSTGLLRSTGQYTPVGSPASIIFLA